MKLALLLGLKGTNYRAIGTLSNPLPWQIIILGVFAILFILYFFKNEIMEKIKSFFKSK